MDTATGKVRGFAVSMGVIGVTAARGIAGPVTVPLVGGPDLSFAPDGGLRLPPPA